MGKIDGETVADFVSLGSKITVDGDCSNEIEICLLLGRKAMTNLDNMFKSIGSLVSAFFVVQLSHPYMTTRKTIALTIQTSVGKVMSAI